MKLGTDFILAVSFWAALSSAAAIESVPATLTDDLVLTTEVPTTTEADLSEAQLLEKRKTIAPKTTTSAPPPRQWIRTRELPTTTIVEIITPTVWEDVTFSASPRTNLKTPLPWLSLNKDGQIKTIFPKMKNGVTQNGHPEYGTWFDEAVTETVNLKTVIDGVKEDTHHEQIKYVPEDSTDRELNPIIRCTPDRYFKKSRKDIKIPSEPFCTPREAANLILDEVYWISWYTKYYPDADKVRLHLAYIEKNKYGKIGKRDTLEKRDSEDAFWSSEWLPNLDGVYPLRIVDEFFLDMQMQDVMLTLQPNTIDDEDFSLVNGTYLKIFRRAIKSKKNTKLRTEEDGDSNSILYVAMTIPTLMVVVFIGYALFNFLVRDNRTWKKLKLKSRRKIWSDPKYQKLPSNTYELERM